MKTPGGVDSDEVRFAIRDAEAELRRAMQKFPAFNSAHEGYAVLLEEVEELWEEVRKHAGDRAAMRAEAVQVAAMALRFLADVCQRDFRG